MRSFLTHMLAGVLGALALGVASHAFAALAAPAAPAKADRSALVWQDSVYKLCYSLKEAEAWIHPDQAYLVHRIVRCGIRVTMRLSGSTLE
jgi:hypothetical protein